jgi:small subunit ribosomal protein S21
MRVNVRENNIDQALRTIKKQMNLKGWTKIKKRITGYIKPSEKRKEENVARYRRQKKLVAQQMKRDGMTSK